jgi:hypothetical protein
LNHSVNREQRKSNDSHSPRPAYIFGAFFIAQTRDPVKRLRESRFACTTQDTRSIAGAQKAVWSISGRIGRIQIAGRVAASAVSQGAKHDAVHFIERRRIFPLEIGPKPLRYYRNCCAKGHTKRAGLRRVVGGQPDATHVDNELKILDRKVL